MMDENDKIRSSLFMCKAFPSHNDSAVYGCHRDMDHSRLSRLLMIVHRNLTPPVLHGIRLLSRTAGT